MDYEDVDVKLKQWLLLEDKEAEFDLGDGEYLVLGTDDKAYMTYDNGEWEELGHIDKVKLTDDSLILTVSNLFGKIDCTLPFDIIVA